MLPELHFFDPKLSLTVAHYLQADVPKAVWIKTNKQKNPFTPSVIFDVEILGNWRRDTHLSVAEVISR